MRRTMNDTDLYRKEDSRKSQNKGAILAQERCTVVLRRLFTFALPPTPISLDYVPPEVVSPEAFLLGFFLTEASQRIP